MADIIKDDFIKRSDALLAAFDLYVRDCSALLNNGIPYQHIKNALRTIKAIDVQPVVRCKDCSIPVGGFCGKLGGYPPDKDFYCAFGISKDGGT